MDQTACVRAYKNASRVRREVMRSSTVLERGRANLRVPYTAAISSSWYGPDTIIPESSEHMLFKNKCYFMIGSADKTCFC